MSNDFNIYNINFLEVQKMRTTNSKTNINTNAKKITAVTVYEIIKNGGATLNADGVAVNFSRGYQVSRRDCYRIATEKANEIAAAVNELLNSISAGEFVGLWSDGGFVYIDISENIKSKKKALKIGRARRQLSIYEWKTGACLDCGRA
jgi:hypothetical protein